MRTQRRQRWSLAVALVLLGANPLGSLAQDAAEGRLALMTIQLRTIGQADAGHEIVLPGYDFLGSPTFSPDGQWVAFDAYKEVAEDSFSPPECWIARRDGQELQRVAQGATPRWSPDGKRLAFMREDQADPDKDLGIFVINRDGTDEQHVGPGRWPDWSPDGDWLVFSLGGRASGGARPLSRVYVARVDGTDRRLIGDGDCPSWAPDGDKIACCYRDPANSSPIIRVVDLKTEEQTLLGPGWWRANWSPDSESLACNGFSGPDQGLVKFTVAHPGREAELLLGVPFWGDSPCYAPDGETIAFVVARLAER